MGDVVSLAVCMYHIYLNTDCLFYMWALVWLLACTCVKTRNLRLVHFLGLYG